MQDRLYTITKNDLFDLFARLAQTGRVFVPYRYNDKFHPPSQSVGDREDASADNSTSKYSSFYFGEFDPSKEPAVELGGVRQTQPFKSFLNPAREIVSGKDVPGPKPAPHHSLAPHRMVPGLRSGTGHVIVAGVKACDLSSLILQDYVFLKGDC